MSYNGRRTQTTFIKNNNNRDAPTDCEYRHHDNEVTLYPPLFARVDVVSVILIHVAPTVVRPYIGRLPALASRVAILLRLQTA